MLDVFGAFGNVLGTGMSIEATRQQNELNREWSTEEAMKARAHATSERIAAQNFNKEMWNLQNEYNDPSAQMERMKNAGINPAAAAQAIAGKGSQAGPVQGSSPGSSPMASSPAQFDIGAALRQGVQTFWQNRKMAAETEGIKLDNEYKPQLAEGQINKLSAEVQKHFVDIEGVKATTENVRELTKQIQVLTPAQLNLLTAQTQDMVSASKLKDAQTRTEEKMPDLLEAQTDATNASRDLTLNQTWTEKMRHSDAEYNALKAEYKKTLMDNGIMLGEHELDMILAYADAHEGNISGLVDPINRYNVGINQAAFDRQTGKDFTMASRDYTVSTANQLIRTLGMIGLGNMFMRSPGSGVAMGAAPNFANPNTLANKMRSNSSRINYGKSYGGNADARNFNWWNYKTK